jgi:hypothetical protein
MKNFLHYLPHFLAFLGAALATFGAALGSAGAGAAAGSGLALAHWSGKFVLTILCIRAHDPKGLFATIYLTGASSAALYSVGVNIEPFSAK